MATKIKTPADWASALLGAEGDQNTPTDVNNLVRWWQAEGGAGPQFGVPNNDDNYNPLNTTLPEPGAISTNSAGVKSYNSWKQGLDATVSTLASPDYGYPNILADLNTSAPYSKFEADVTASSWGTHLSGTTADPSATPSSNAYDSGVQATIDSGSAANSPSKSTQATNLVGLGGILQTLDGLYNPAQQGLNWNPIHDLTLIPSDVEHTAIEIFTRAASSILALGLILMGIKTFLSGGSDGGSSSGGNVLEFVNNAKVSNAKIGQASERISAAAQKEEHVVTRHGQRLADKEQDRVSRERVAATPKVNFHFKKSEHREYKESHIYHHTNPKPNPKNAKERGLKP
jgi:hypothetical protein